MENPPPEYERDDRSDSFRMIGDLLVTIAEKYNINVDSETSNRWQDLMGLLRDFDTYVDDQAASREQAIQQLADFTLFSKNYPNLTPAALGSDLHNKMVKRVEKIIEHGDEIQTTTDTSSFINHRKEEAYESAELLSDCATGDTTTQPGFHTQLMPAFRSMAEAANFIDTVLDFYADKTNEKIAISPTPELLLDIGGIALRSFNTSKHILIHPDILKHFADISFMRITNRIKHGSQPYSSLSLGTGNV